jgi:Zn-dependent peptidase ImmA (M78 family)
VKLERGSVFARMLLEELGGSQDVRSMARELRLEIKEVDSEGFDGALVRARKLPIGTIVVRTSIREVGRKNFTIGHEIGHFILPGHDQADLVCTASDIGNWGDGNKELEREADEFAAELLMPKDTVEPIVKSRQPSISAIEEIAQMCSTSLSAAAWRYMDITSDRCAAAWSTHRMVAWAKRSREFGYSLQKGKTIEKGTFAHDCFNLIQVPNEPEPVVANLWIESSHLPDGAKIFENSKALPAYTSVLSVLWIKHAIENVDDSRELLDELDPKEFTLSRQRWPR